MFDLLRISELLRRHVATGKVSFGINHEMRDFRNNRKKDLDLVLSVSGASGRPGRETLTSLTKKYSIILTDQERGELAALPELRQFPVGNVLVALEAKACMTAHQRALPRLYDELNSSHQTVHGAHDLVVAAGFVMINAAEKFLSPDLNKRNYPANPEWSEHQQPRAVSITMDKIRELPRRSKPQTEGYDALGIVVIDCANDGSPVTLVAGPPSPLPSDIHSYASMIDRLRGLYETRFSQI